jgi:hypothetical protein
MPEKRLEKSISIRITKTMYADIEELARYLKVKPVDIARMSIAVGLKVLDEREPEDETT